MQLRQGGNEPVDLVLRTRFGDCHEEALIADLLREPVEVRKAAEHWADIDSGGGGFADRHVGTVFVLQRELFEERAGEEQFAAFDLLQSVGGIVGFAAAEFGDFFQAAWAEQRQIDRRTQCQQALVRADVAHRTRAADVLFACLQVEEEAALAVAIDRLADQPARHLANEFLAAGEDAEIRPTELEWDAKPLSFRDGDVGPEFTRPLEQPDADRVERLDEKRASLMSDGSDLLDILQSAEEVRVLNDHARGRLVDRRLQLRNADLTIGCWQDEDLGQLIGKISRDALRGFRIHGTRDDHAARSTGATHRHEYRLGDAAPPVVQTRVGNIESAQLGDQRLKLEEWLKQYKNQETDFVLLCAKIERSAEVADILNPAQMKSLKEFPAMPLQQPVQPMRLIRPLPAIQAPAR